LITAYLRTDFADAQFGKGPVDRMASATKANVRCFVNEKNDHITSSNFVEIAKATCFMTIVAWRLPDVSSKSTTR
jgi:HKD family nuclease